jgi:hypothetical protein
MALPKGAALALGAQDAALLRSRFLSMIASSSGPDNTPSIARALGCRLSPDLRRITLFFSASDARELLDHVTLTGRIAAVFAVPRTHKAMQLKAVDASVGIAGPHDLQVVNSYRQAFVGHLADMGYPRHLIEALVACQPEDLASVTFTPSAAFSQTPGPRAGHAIGATT